MHFFHLKYYFKQAERSGVRNPFICVLLTISQAAAEGELEKYVEIRNKYRHQDCVMKGFNEDYDALQSALCDEEPLAITHKR